MINLDDGILRTDANGQQLDSPRHAFGVVLGENHPVGTEDI